MKYLILLCPNGLWSQKGSDPLIQMSHLGCNVLRSLYGMLEQHSLDVFAMYNIYNIWKYILTCFRHL